MTTRALKPQTGSAVLYVEDDENDLFLMQMAFSREGLKSALQTVTTGQAAIDYLAGRGAYSERDQFPLPSVLLLDINLPETHGFEVLKWVRDHSQYGSLPVVIFTSSQREEDRATARLLGANEFVTKPNSLDLFRTLVRDLNERWLSEKNVTH